MSIFQAYLASRPPRSGAWRDKLPNESCPHLPATAGHWCRGCERDFRAAVARARRKA